MRSQRELNGRHRRLAAAAAIAGLLALGTGGARAEEAGGCYGATVPAPFVLPDGSVHPQSELRICMTRRLSPVEWLHVTYVGGGAIGAFRGGDSLIERGYELRQPDFVFLRRSDGSLRLFGFISSDPAGSRLHNLLPMARLGRERESDDVILVAALGD